MFITFEGGEGAGKSTLMRKMAHEMTARGYSVIQTHEPGSSKLGHQIRQWLLSRDSGVSVGIKTELMLFLADRAQHIQEVITPALKEGKIILCDRFNDSTIAYQGFARGMGMNAVEEICNFVCDGLTPDLTFFLDIDPIVAMQRINAKTLDRMEVEKLEFHQKVRQGFHTIAKKNPERFHILDATGSEEDVFDKAMKSVVGLLSRKH